MKNFRFLVFFWVVGTLNPLAAGIAQSSPKFLLGKDESKVLPVESAFQMFIEKNKDLIEVRWLIAPGYYLYKDKLNFSIDVDKLIIPQGAMYYDDFFGEVEVYFGELAVKIPIKSQKRLSKEIIVSFQGCSQSGFCYPAQKRQISI